jgi:hypothetical protein
MMKGDFTRLTHDPSKHYTGVLKQQGRVDLDADWNEQVAIERYLTRSEAKDVIGLCGAPREGGGFKIGVRLRGPSARPLDLSISAGRFYVDGILCELERSANYGRQPHYPRPTALRPEEGRTDLVYLDVWEHHITAVEDPDIRETALGGPDTTTRVKTVWQVRVHQNVEAEHCGDQIRGWPPPPSGGRLSTDVVSTDSNEDPCSLAPSGGYQGLENRLYRVEIHEGGDLDDATFKWSRDNGSVVFSVEAFVGGQPTRQLKVKRLGHDRVLALHVGDWVEVLDDERDFRGDGLRVGEPGTMAQITEIDEAERIITLDREVLGYDLDKHAKVRRWDQPSAAIRATEGPIKLEEGVQIQFSGRGFRTGDYWTFAARAATGEVERLKRAAPQGIEHHTCRLALLRWVWGDSRRRRLVIPRNGDFEPDLAEEWEVFDNGERTVFSLAQGLTNADGSPLTAEEVTEILTGEGLEAEVIDDLSLAIFGPHNDVMEALSEVEILPASEILKPQIRDCRPTFPTLTGICAEDVCYDNSETPGLGDVEDVQEAVEALYHLRKDGCTLVLLPGPGWERNLERLERGGDAHLCFQVGEYPLEKGVVLANKGHLKVTGCGPGTRIVARKGEAALQFKDCKSVTVRDLYAEAKKTGADRLEHLRGVLTFRGCGPVTVENVTLTCGSGARRAAACLSVFYGRRTEREELAHRNVTVRDCTMHVGHQQAGILVVNAMRIRVMENVVRGRNRPRYLTLSRLLKNPHYRAGVRRLLIHAANLNPSGEELLGGIPPGHVLAQENEQSVLFRTDLELVDAWNSLLEARPPRGVQSHQDLYRHLQNVADRLLLNQGRLPDLARSPRGFREWYEELEEEHGAAAAQGIVVGGIMGKDIQVTGNTVQGVRQGVHLGASHGGRRGRFYPLGRVQVADNVIGVLLPPLDRERHGVFVGSCDSLLIERNYVEIEGSDRVPLPIEGIRVYGALGPMMMIRQNHLEGCTTGIRVKPLNDHVPSQRQWLVAENLMPSVERAIVAPGSVKKRDNVP